VSEDALVTFDVSQDRHSSQPYTASITKTQPIVALKFLASADAGLPVRVGVYFSTCGRFEDLS
jgi:hypothetical protein